MIGYVPAEDGTRRPRRSSATAKALKINPNEETGDAADGEGRIDTRE